MNPVDRAAPLRALALSLSLSLSLLAPGALAQSSPAIDLLHRSPDAGARARAAEALGRLRPMGARAALEAALGDRAASVRAASAQALEALGEPAAIAALNHHALDHDAAARDAVMHALHTLMARMPTHTAGAWSSQSAPNPAAVPTIQPVATPTPRRINWSRVRVLISLGPIANHATLDAGHVLQLREALQAAMVEDERYALHPGTTLPSSVTARLRSGSLRRYSLEGGLTTLRESGNIAVRAEVSLILLSEPAHAIAATLAGSGTVQEAPPVIPDLPDPLPRLRLRAIEAAAHGALRELQSQLLNRRASR